MTQHSKSLHCLLIPRNFLTICALMCSMLPVFYAQNKFSVELNGGPALSEDELVEEVDLRTGFALEGLVYYRFHRILNVYTGWGWTRFPTESIRFDLIDVGEADFDEIGLRFGLEVKNSIGDTRYGYFFRAGGVYTQIRAETKDGTFSGESDWNVDWQASLGASVEVGPSVQLKAGYRYQLLNRELEYEALLPPTDVDISYYAFTLGILYRLPI